MKKIIFILFLITGASLFSQTLSSVLEKKTIAVGEPNVYKIRIDGLAGKIVEIAPKNELLPFHFEEISDNTKLQGDTYEREIEFTVFEEGTFRIPSYDIKIGGETSRTIAYELEVINTAQQGEAINDIMKNKEVKLNMQDYWQMYKLYLLAFLAVLGIVFLIWQFAKYGKKRNSLPVKTTNQTLKQLEQLKKKKYIENGNYRLFYVELMEISRNFITQQYRIPADVLLTDDLVRVMQQNQTISAENEKIIEDIFLRGDMVKFAKTVPDKPTMEDDFKHIKNFVKRASKDVEFENLRKDV